MAANPTPEPGAQQAQFAAQAQRVAAEQAVMQEQLRLVIALADVTVALRGPEAATEALYILQSFVRQFGQIRSQMPPDVQKLLAAAEAASKAATEVMSRRVIVPGL